jgi:hypothetical protein
MTICGLLLRHRFYSLNPSERLKYATLGLLFVNISVGGVLTQFACLRLPCISTLTVIANSPNPAGQSFLASRFGEAGISPLYLFPGALVPTLIAGAAFMLLPDRYEQSCETEAFLR